MSGEHDRLRVLAALPDGSEASHAPLAFSDLLRRFRRAANLTQEQLAERAGLSVAGISALERGAKTSPQRETVRLLAEALALTTEDRQRLAATVVGRRAPNAGVAARPPEWVPPQLGALIGRERELADLDKLLADPACRLLTLTGPGGIGKTRLAMQAAADAHARFTDGVCFVALTAVSSTALIASAIADALALTMQSQYDPQEQILKVLRERELLLLLDNFEHLLDGITLVGALLRGAPGVRILATSRERLNLREEHTFIVEGLAVPEDETGEALVASGAVRLFVASARRVDAHFAPMAAERPHITRICQLVEGMPLGIELAAAWVSVLPCAEIAQEIAQNLDFLAMAPRDAPERHQTMRAAFDYSWRLLSEHQRQVFRGLTVFHGGFQRAAAEAVAGASLLTISELMDKSLLRRTPAGRFEVHELLRQYGAAQLDADVGAARQARARHCAYYLDYLAQREEQLRGHEQQATLDAIDAELENLRAAWHWATEQADAALIARATEALWLYYTERGRAWEGEAAFAAAVAALEVPSGAARRGDAPRELALGMALARHASYQFRLGAYARARVDLERSVALFRRLDVPRELGFALNFLAATVHLTGDPHEERRLLEESVALLRRAGDRWCAAYSLNDLALLTHLLGDLGGAQQLARESLTIFEEFGDRRGIGFAFNTFGEIAAHRGDYCEAARFHRESLALRLTIGDYWGIAYSLHQLGIVALQMGSRDAARGHFLEALRAARAGHALPLALDTLIELATLDAEIGEATQALTLLLPALRHPARTRRTGDKGERLLAALEGRLPQAAGMARAYPPPEAVESVVDTLLRASTEPRQA